MWTFQRISLIPVVLLMSLVATCSQSVGLTRVLPLRRMEFTMHGGIPKFPLLGTYRNPYLGGSYYTTIKLGSPPQKLHVQIDTGSNDLWVNCKPCENCPVKSKLGFRPNLFIPEKSSTARPLGCMDQICISTTGGQCTNESSECGFSKEYGDGRGAFGYYLYDMIEFDVVMPPMKNTSAQILFGCSSYLSGGFTQENQSIDGILGLGKLFPSPVLQIAQVIIPPIFSHCLGGDGNGTLILGEFDYDEAASIVYTPLLPATMYYNIDLQGITVKGKLLPINQNVFNTSNTSGTIVDTGTSLSYLVPEAYDAFLDAINTAVAKYAAPTHYEGTICYKMSISHIDRFPSVAFNFSGDATMVLNPKDYFITHQPIIDGASSLCIGFQKTMEHNFTILGNLVLKDKIIIYDIERKRLGWSSYYNCSEGIVRRVSESSGVARSITIIRSLMIFILYMILM